MTFQEADHCCSIKAGTMRLAELKPDIPASFFSKAPEDTTTKNVVFQSQAPKKALSEIGPADSDVFDGDDIFDDFHFDRELSLKARVAVSRLTLALIAQSIITEGPRNQENVNRATNIADEEEPVELPTGKWACNHKCKDKTT